MLGIFLTCAGKCLQEAMGFGGFFGCLFFLLVFCFLGLHQWHIEVPGLGVESELQLLAYTTAHGNAGSLTHRARPGIEPASLWMLVRFVSAEP